MGENHISYQLDTECTWEDDLKTIFISILFSHTRLYTYPNQPDYGMYTCNSQMHIQNKPPLHWTQHHISHYGKWYVYTEEYSNELVHNSENIRRELEVILISTPKNR
jgi:hypothetical protein